MTDPRRLDGMLTPTERQWVTLGWIESERERLTSVDRFGFTRGRDVELNFAHEIKPSGGLRTADLECIWLGRVFSGGLRDGFTATEMAEWRRSYNAGLTVQEVALRHGTSCWYVTAALRNFRPSATL